MKKRIMRCKHRACPYKDMLCYHRKKHKELPSCGEAAGYHTCICIPANKLERMVGLL